MIKRVTYVLLCLIIFLPGCALLSKDISGITREPVLMRSENITFFRPHDPVPVVIRVKNPGMVYQYLTRVTGSGYLRGATTRIWEIGETLKNASPYIWGKYLDVRSENNTNLPVIEMEIAHISGGGVHDMSGVGIFSRKSLISNDLALCLSCRFFNEDGKLVKEFTSAQKYSKITDNVKDISVYVRPERLLEAGFNDILSEFFRDKAVEVILKGLDVVNPPGQDIKNQLPGRSG